MKNREKNSSGGQDVRWSRLEARWSRLDSEQVQVVMAELFNFLYPRVLKEALRTEELLRSSKLDRFESPVQYAFVAAYCCRLETWLKTFGQKEVTLGPEFITIMEDLGELHAVMSGNKASTEKDEDLKMGLGDALTKAGVSFSDASEFVDVMVGPKGRGAPRDIATSTWALNLRIRGGSYKEIVQALCPCNKKEHDPHCVGAMIKRVKELEGIYEKCCEIINNHPFQK